MEKQQSILTYDEIMSIFNRMDHLKESIKKKESELHGRIVKEINPHVILPPSLKHILVKDFPDAYQIEARKELLHVSMELRNILGEIK